MKFTHYIYMAPLALLAACTGDELTSDTVSHPNGAIELSASIAEGGNRVVTRAGAEDHHATPGHLTLTTGTKLALRVSGEWKHGETTTSIVKLTTASVGAETDTDSKHNTVSCSPTLYWDDYGMADPDNASTGRTEGLTIYGAAINGKKTLPTELSNISNWEAFSWTLAADQTTANNTPADKDLLISNNVQPAHDQNPDETDCGTYKFEKRENGKLLEFTHALSKITVNLKAGDGFTNSAFTKTPEVKLTSNEANASTKAEWPYTTGTINITTGAVTSQGGSNIITMYNSTTATSGWTKTYEALVMPGSAFKKDAIIARIDADGNIYYVKADKIRAAINSTAHDTDDLTEAGKNYIINVFVNKTDIVVTATVTDWVNIEATQEFPVINVNADWGSKDAATDNQFSFYRSTSLNNGYSTGMQTADNFYPYESLVSKSGDTWTMTPVLYWPDHNTHYQFRGVYPATVTEAGDGVTSPRVEDATHNSTNYQIIKVKNVAYQKGTFPSDLMIGRPEVETDATCSNSDHSAVNLFAGGICATEGKINLNFRYMMSQVEVHLSTTTGTDAVELTNAKVELVNVYNTGDVKLGDRGVFTTGNKGSYTLDALTDNAATTGVDESKHRWSAIVPQPLTFTTAQADGNVKFRITITNANNTTDVYYADIQPIKVKVQGSSDTAAAITAWESGKHYIYDLKLTKTNIEVTATITDWTTVEASEEVWF